MNRKYLPYIYICSLIVGTPAYSAPVSYGPPVTLSQSSSTTTWEGQIGLASSQSAFDHFGQLIENTPNKDYAFYVSIKGIGGAKCSLSAQQMKISISTMWDRTYVFPVASSSLNIEDGHTATIHVRETDWKNTGGNGVYTWYLKEAYAVNPVITCTDVPEGVTEPAEITFGIKSGHFATRGNTTTVSASTKVPSTVTIKAGPKESVQFSLWSTPTGTLPVTVDGPARIPLESGFHQIFARRLNEDGLYELVTDGPAGRYHGSADVKLRAK